MRKHNAEETSPSGRRTGPVFLPEIVPADGGTDESTRLGLSDRVRREHQDVITVRQHNSEGSIQPSESRPRDDFQIVQCFV